MWTWEVVGERVTERHIVEHLETLLNTPKQHGSLVFISQHDYYATDHGWPFEGVLKQLMHAIGMFDRQGPLTLEGSKGAGAIMPTVLYWRSSTQASRRSSGVPARCGH